MERASVFDVQGWIIEDLADFYLGFECLDVLARWLSEVAKVGLLGEPSEPKHSNPASLAPQPMVLCSL